MVIRETFSLLASECSVRKKYQAFVHTFKESDMKRVSFSYLLPIVFLATNVWTADVRSLSANASGMPGKGPMACSMC